MGIYDGHRERVRERFLKGGLANFNEKDALEFLLFYARPRQSTNQMAHVLLQKFGSLSAVIDATVDELLTVDGLGESSAVLLKLIPEICSYYLISRSKTGVLIDSTQKAKEFLIPRFFGKTKEEIHVLSLSNKGNVIRCVSLSDDGIVNAVSVSVKQIVAEAISSNATRIVLAHNHPGGLTTPSQEDIEITRRIFHALLLIDVQLVEHLIVVDDDCLSMSENGYLQEIQNSPMP